MALYNPRHFTVEDRAVAEKLIAEHPFATFIVVDRGEPWIAHIPMSIRGDDLIGHVAKANPISKFLDGNHAAIAIFHGPHAYISPTWYDTPDQVPTWNYAVAHVHGTPAALSGNDAVREVLDLVRAYDPAVMLDPEKVSRQASGIVAFSMPMGRIDVKLKMSQNKSEQDRSDVIAALQKRNSPDDRAVAGWMSRLSEPVS